VFHIVPGVPPVPWNTLTLAPWFYSKTTKADLAISFCTDSGKFFEHIYGFLMVVERIFEKHAEKNLDKKGE